MDNGIRIEQEKSFFTIIPNMVDDMDLSVYAFRLYAHIRRVAGDGGKCYQSTNTLAESCHMSAGAVSNAKKELEQSGLISVSFEINEHQIPGLHTIRLINIWRENVDKYSDTGERSPHERPRSPHETNNNPLRRIDNDKGILGNLSVFQEYENEIGVVSQHIADRLKVAESEYPREWITKAFQVAAENNARSWSYIEKVLQNMKTKGVNWRPNGKSHEPHEPQKPYIPEEHATEVY
jgi:DnaD/phage-associated family protein